MPTRLADGLGRKRLPYALRRYAPLIGSPVSAHAELGKVYSIIVLRILSRISGLPESFLKGLLNEFVEAGEDVSGAVGEALHVVGQSNAA